MGERRCCVCGVKPQDKKPGKQASRYCVDCKNSKKIPHGLANPKTLQLQHDAYRQRRFQELDASVPLEDEGLIPAPLEDFLGLQ